MTSADVYMYLTTLAIVVVAVFLCWALYYCILILKRIYRMLDAIEECLQSWSTGWDSLFNRFSTMRDSLQLVAQGVKAASSVYQRYTNKSTKKSPKSKNEDSD